MPHNLVKLLEKNLSGLGLLAIMNFVDAVQCKALSADLAREFIQAWARSCTRLNTPNGTLYKLRSVRESHNNFLKNTGNELPSFKGHIFTILRYDDLDGRLNETTRFPGMVSIHNLAQRFREATNTANREHLERSILQIQEHATRDGYFDIQFKEGTSIKGKAHSLIWIATAEPGAILKDQESHRSTARSAADITRDNLGLIHIGFDFVNKEQDFPLLVALKIDTSELFSSTGPIHSKPWRPTAIDAGDHSRFRGAYGDLRKCAKEWGRAIHLEALTDQSGSLGATEAVVMNFRPKKAKMTFLGFPRIPRGDLPGRNDTAFVKNLLRQRSQKSLKLRFINI